MAKIGGLIAVVSLCFLPVAGCGNAAVTGLQILRADDVGVILKALIGLSMLCAVLALAATTVIELFATGGGGIVSLLICYALARQKIPFDLKEGTYLAFLGFGLVLIGAALRQQQDAIAKPLDDV